MSDITIRSARPADAPALGRLAALDSQRLPAGDLLVAEVCGELVAAYAPASERVVADPFRFTATIVALLRVRAAGTPVTHRARRELPTLPRLA